MYLEELIIEGFKSYVSRTHITGWDPEFNAITGLNGSGKSNVLDAICFVLGITNLSHVIYIHIYINLFFYNKREKIKEENKRKCLKTVVNINTHLQFFFFFFH